MAQKLSAMKYITNNKRRVLVLVISLGLSFVLTYVTNFLLSATTETFRPMLLEYTRRIQYVSIAGSSFGIDIDNPDSEALESEYKKENDKLAEKLRSHENIKDAFFSEYLNLGVDAVIGKMSLRVPLVEKEKIPELMEQMDAKLSEGRLPENPGEIIVDKATMKNQEFTLNGYFNEKSYNKAFTIVGVMDCDLYFCFGLPKEDFHVDSMLTILSGCDDIGAELQKEGIILRDNYDKAYDYIEGKQSFKDDVTDPMHNSTKFIYVAIIVLLSVSLFIVYTMYLRDRRNEWCLYRSIGFSGKAVYFSIIRELLFTFAAALFGGGILIVVSVAVLNSVMIEPKGIKTVFFNGKTICEIFCSYVFLMGMLQIPVRYAIYKIRTIDSMDDDIY